MDIARQRLANQRLVGKPFAKPEDVVRHMGAVQAQDFAGAKWALAQRTKGLTDQDLNEAFNAGRILRTHMLRPTWHFVAREDIRWILSLTSPRVHALNAYYYRQGGLDKAAFDKTEKAMARALQGGNYLTRNELAKVFEADGIEATGVRLAYIVARAELDQVICSGPLRGKQFTYALLDERAPATSYSWDKALAELTKRYFTSHGPATQKDFMNWSSIPMMDAAEGVHVNDFQSEDWEGKTYVWAKESPKPAKGLSIRLLPNYDEHAVNYKDYSPLFEPGLQSQSQSGVPLWAHILVSAGKVVGGWRRTLAKNSVEIEVSLLRSLTEQEQSLLEVEAERYCRFIGCESWRILGG